MKSVGSLVADQRGEQKGWNTLQQGVYLPLVIKMPESLLEGSTHNVFLDAILKDVENVISLR